MRKRVIVLCLCVVGLLALCLGWLSLHPNEPEISGHRFSYWFRRLEIPFLDPAADRAIAAMGTNCLPCLLDRLSHPPTRAQERVDYFFRHEAPWLQDLLLWDHWHPLGRREWESACRRSFGLIGPAAKQAVPQLERLLEDPATGEAAAWALAGVGPEAWPCLMRALTNPNPTTRLHALVGLQGVGTNAGSAVPQVVACLQSSNKTERFLGAIILGGIKQQPAISVPALIAALDDADAGVQGTAAAALASFPEQAGPAVPKLITLQNSTNSRLNKSIAYALKAIGQPADSPRTNQAAPPAPTEPP